METERILKMMDMQMETDEKNDRMQKLRRMARCYCLPESSVVHLSLSRLVVVVFSCAFNVAQRHVAQASIAELTI